MLLHKDMKDAFFQFVRDRQQIWYNRFILKKPKEEWTNDPILKTYKFCNVFRELDRGTQIIVENIVKNNSLSMEQKFINILAYRFFNSRWFFDDIGIIYEFKREEFRDKMKAAKEKYGKCFSSAYLIGPNTLNPTEKGKIAQVSFALEYAWIHLDKVFYPLLNETDPKKLMMILQQVKLVGGFLTYQVLLDLIYTGKMAADDNCPLFVGPGVIAGIMYWNKIGRKEIKNPKDYVTEIYESQSDYVDLWKDIYPPKELLFAPNSERHEISWNNIEFSLCEFRKYTKIKDGIRGRHRKYTCEV